MHASLPADFKSEESVSLCFKHGMCVCGKADGTDRASDALFCHSNLVRFLRPYVALTRKPKQRTPSGRPGSAGDAGPPAQTPETGAKTKVADREARKPPTRKLLDKSFLVARFCLPEEVQAMRKADMPTAYDAWHAAAASVFKRCDENIEEEFWFHISYCNLQTMMFSMLQLHRVADAPTHDLWGRQIVRLQVPQEVQFFTTVQAFNRFALRLKWNVSWYAIDTSSKPIDEDVLIPNTVDVRLIPEAQIPEFCVWKGSDAEATLREQERREGRKRTAKSGARKPAKPFESAQKRPRLGPGPGKARDQAETADTVPPADEAAADDLPTMAELFEEPLDRASESGAESDGPANEDPDQDLGVHAGLHELATFLPPRGHGEASVDDGPGVLGAEPSSSSSAVPRPAALDAAAALAAPAKSEGKAKAAPKMTAAAKAGGGAKVKEVTETVFKIQREGVEIGSLVFNPRSKHLTAHCRCKEHEASGGCRKQRTTAPAAKAVAQGKTGRPIGFLVHWLLQCENYADSHDHVHLLNTATFDERRKARAWFCKLAGGRRFSEAVEAAKSAADEDDEPITC